MGVEGEEREGSTLCFGLGGFGGIGRMCFVTVVLCRPDDVGELYSGRPGVAAKFIQLGEDFLAFFEDGFDRGPFVESTPVDGPVGEGDGGVAFGLTQNGDAVGSLLAESYGLHRAPFAG